MRGFNGARGERVGLENLSLFFCENVNSLCEKTGYLSCDYTFVNRNFRSDLISRYYL